MKTDYLDIVKQRDRFAQHVREDISKNLADEGYHSPFPSVTSLAEKYNLDVDQVIEFVEDSDELDFIVAFRTENGIYDIPRESDYLVEFFGDE
jgi:HKD family nuclease